MIRDPLSSTQRHQYELLHDARAVHDTACFRFADFKVNGAASWTLAVIKPDPVSGSATVPGGYIRAESGELVIPEGGRSAVLKKGIWQVIAAGGPKPPQPGTYSWSEPLGLVKRVLTPEDYYSPFAYGGTVVFRPIPGARGIEQFGPVYLFFPEWGGFVLPALDLAVNSEILHGKLIRDGRTAELDQLVDHENSLIATIAFRESIKDNMIAPQLLSGFLGLADDRRRSIFTYILLAMSPPDMANGIVQAIGDRLQEMWQPDEIQSIALGAFAAMLFHSGETEVIARSKTVLIAARQRLHDIEKTVGPDSPLQLMFTIMGIEP